MIDEEAENIGKQKLNGQGEQNDQQVSVQVKITHVCKLYIHQTLADPTLGLLRPWP